MDILTLNWSAQLLDLCWGDIATFLLSHQSKARGELQGKNLTKLGLKTERCDNIKKIKKGCEMKYAS